MTGLKDWSARHVRTRAEMVSVALAVFLCARVGVSPGGGTFLGLEFPAWLTRDVLAFWLALLFIYLLLAFIVRTRAELSHVASQAGKLNRALQRIDDMRKRTSDLRRRLDGALVSERLSAWNDAVRKISVLPNEEETSLIRALGADLDGLRRATEGIAASIGTGANDSGPRPFEVVGQEEWQAKARQALARLAEVEKVGRSFEGRAAILKETLVETEKVLSDARGFFSNEDGRGAEDLNEKLETAVAELKAVRDELRSGLRALSVERHLFSVRLPKWFSFLLVLVSADAIFRGALQSADNIAEFVQTNIAVLGSIS